MPDTTFFEEKGKIWRIIRIKMKIGIDARFYQQAGIGRYLRNLISHLQTLDKKGEYFIFLLPKDVIQFKLSKNFHAVEANFPWYGFAEQFKLPQLLNKFKLDLAHFPHFNVPIFYTGKFIVTIHDLIHQHHSMSRATTRSIVTFKIKQFGYRRVFKYSVTKSQKILVPSHCVEDLLKREWNVKGEKIMVTPEAVDDKILLLANKMTKADIERVLNKFGIKQPYLFYVGNAHPHKNLEGLIKAFLTLQRKYHKLTLVLSGYDHYFWQRLKREHQHESIKYTGEITDEELVALYKGANCFVLPSFEEGFGIPLLEAFGCGCPVVSSNGGSLPEVGRDAAVYFNPLKQADMVDKIDQVFRSERLRKELAKLGQSRVKLFSWKALAKQTLGVYLQCV